jgi:hypothetical protein
LFAVIQLSQVGFEPALLTVLGLSPGLLALPPLNIPDYSPHFEPFRQAFHETLRETQHEKGQNDAGRDVENLNHVLVS